MPYETIARTTTIKKPKRMVKTFSVFLLGDFCFEAQKPPRNANSNGALVVSGMQ